MTSNTCAAPNAWLECGDEKLPAILGEVEQLARRLGGSVSIRPQTVLASLPAEAVGAFRGGLALAGATFVEPEQTDDSAQVLAFVLTVAPKNNKP